MTLNTTPYLLLPMSLIIDYSYANHFYCSVLQVMVNNFTLASKYLATLQRKVNCWPIVR